MQKVQSALCLRKADLAMNWLSCVYRPQDELHVVFDGSVAESDCHDGRGFQV